MWTIRQTGRGIEIFRMYQGCKYIVHAVLLVSVYQSDGTCFIIPSVARVDPPLFCSLPHSETLIVYSGAGNKYLLTELCCCQLAEMGHRQPLLPLFRRFAIMFWRIERVKVWVYFPPDGHGCMGARRERGAGLNPCSQDARKEAPWQLLPCARQTAVCRMICRYGNYLWSVESVESVEIWVAHVIYVDR